MVRTKGKRKAEPEDEVEEGEEPLFTIDTAPAKKVKHRFQPVPVDTPGTPVPASADEAAEESVHASDSEQKLDKGKGRAIETEPTEEELEALRDLQADEVDGADRYYAGPGKVDKTHKCSLCNEYGHSIRDCTHQQCATCGALDDHSFKNCPSSRTCFRCGAKGHTDKTCTNPQSSRSTRCSNCNTTGHTTFACHLNWRVYTYRSTKSDDAKPQLVSCYNCGNTATDGSGHFGNECPIPRGHPLHHVDPSAFTNGQGPPASAMRSARGPSSFPSAPSGPRRPNIVNGVRQRQTLPSKPQSIPRNGRHTQYDDIPALTADEEGTDLFNRISKRAYPPKNDVKRPKIAISFNPGKGFDGVRPTDRDDRRDRPIEREKADYRRPSPPPSRRERRERERERRSPPPLLSRIARRDHDKREFASAPNWQRFQREQQRSRDERDDRPRPRRG